MVLGALAAYVVVLVGVVLAAPGLAASVIIAGVVAALGVVVGIGAVVYARGANSGETYRSVGDVSPPETVD